MPRLSSHTMLSPGVLALAATCAHVVTAQQAGWASNQVNATMCNWQQPRAALVKDTVYIDGGYLWWTPGLSTGEYGVPTQDGNPLGLVYTLNFSTPFNTSDNTSEILGTLSKAPSGGAANNFAPNYFDGAMLGNDHEWFLYGGLLTLTDAYDSTPAADDVLGYQVSQYGVEKPAFKPGFVKYELPDNLTRYLTFGGAANAPSENKAWYFGGMTSTSGGEIFYPSSNTSLNPTNYSNTLITLDMATQQSETWDNDTLPDHIKSRANPELVWVPIGEQGILVVLGGVTYPEFAAGSHISKNETASKAESGEFMSTIDIYDIANKKWYQQPTVSGPPARTRGCAVVSHARDFSSLNIYWYGGYDGLDPTDDFDDDIWILSLPSFLWKKIKSGTSGHGRAGHKCFMPYPDQMFVIGGYPAQSGEATTCLQNEELIQIVNLTSGEWLDTYHPDQYHDYGVPEVIHSAIGGDWAGGATMMTPTPTGWADASLASVFATPYPTEKLTTYYPYAVTSNTTGDRGKDESHGGGGWPGWAPIVLGVLLGLLFLVSILFAFFIYRRRKLLRKSGDQSVSTEESGNRIISWIRGQPSEQKAPTISTEETPTSPSIRVEQPLPLPTTPPVIQYHEMADTSVAEMMDTSPRVELENTGLTPVDVINKHTHFGNQNSGSLNNPSFYSGSGISQNDHASIVTGSSTGNALGVSPSSGGASNSAIPPRPQPTSPMSTSASPSPVPGDSSDTPTTPPQRMVSASSGTSAQRQLRGNSVSTMGDDTAGPNANAAPSDTLVSPQTAADEFPGARRQTVSSQGPGSLSPLRRSIFYENEEDLSGR